MAAGPGELIAGLALQVRQTTLQVLDLRPTSMRTPDENVQNHDGWYRCTRREAAQKGSFFLASLSRSASISRRRLRIVS
jgi:hypothetical protein